MSQQDQSKQKPTKITLKFLNTASGPPQQVPAEQPVTIRALGATPSNTATIVGQSQQPLATSIAVQQQPRVAPASSMSNTTLHINSGHLQTAKATTEQQNVVLQQPQGLIQIQAPSQSYSMRGAYGVQARYEEPPLQMGQATQQQTVEKVKLQAAPAQTSSQSSMIRLGGGAVQQENRITINNNPQQPVVAAQQTIQQAPVTKQTLVSITSAAASVTQPESVQLLSKIKLTAAPSSNHAAIVSNNNMVAPVKIAQDTSSSLNMIKIPASKQSPPKMMGASTVVTATQPKISVKVNNFTADEPMQHLQSSQPCLIKIGGSQLIKMPTKTPEPPAKASTVITMAQTIQAPQQQVVLPPSEKAASHITLKFMAPTSSQQPQLAQPSQQQVVTPSPIVKMTVNSQPQKMDQPQQPQPSQQVTLGGGPQSIKAYLAPSQTTIKVASTAQQSAPNVVVPQQQASKITLGSQSEPIVVVNPQSTMTTSQVRILESASSNTANQVVIGGGIQLKQQDIVMKNTNSGSSNEHKSANTAAAAATQSLIKIAMPHLDQHKQSPAAQVQQQQPVVQPQQVTLKQTNNIQPPPVQPQASTSIIVQAAQQDVEMTQSTPAPIVVVTSQKQPQPQQQTPAPPAITAQSAITIKLGSSQQQQSQAIVIPSTKKPAVDLSQQVISVAAGPPKHQISNEQADVVMFQMPADKPQPVAPAATSTSQVSLPVQNKNSTAILPGNNGSSTLWSTTNNQQHQQQNQQQPNTVTPISFSANTISQQTASKFSAPAVSTHQTNTVVQQQQQAAASQSFVATTVSKMQTNNSNQKMATTSIISNGGNTPVVVLPTKTTTIPANSSSNNGNATAGTTTIIQQQQKHNPQAQQQQSQIVINTSSTAQTSLPTAATATVQQQPVSVPISIPQQPQLIPRDAATTPNPQQKQPRNNNNNNNIQQQHQQQQNTAPMQQQQQSTAQAAAGGKREKSVARRLNLMEFYYVTKRTLALELDPSTKSYRGQVRMELALKMNEKTKTSLLEQQIEECKKQGLNRVLLEAGVLSKQVCVVGVFLLAKDGETGEFKKEQGQKYQVEFAEGNLADPISQAKVNPELYAGLSRHLYQLEEVQRRQAHKQLTNGTIQLKLKKKLFQFKNAEKVKRELFVMIDFLCDHVTDVGGLKCISYRRELADQLYQQSNQPLKSCNDYFYTSDEPNQSVSWLPQLVGSQKMASAWYLQFLVPKDFMVLASGKRLDRSVEDGTALHEYELVEAERTIPDRIGFIVCPIPLQTPFDVQGKKDLGMASFLSRQKQGNFNPKLASDTIDYICSLMGQRHFPQKDTKLVFLPNLFPAKFPKQSFNFAGGLHLLDQELLYRANQIDKRHHLYKHLASSLTFAFFGSKVREAEWSDMWLLVAIRERVGERFTKSKCGALLYRYHVMKRIEKLYKLMKEGIEITPLQRIKGRDPETCPELKGLGCPDPSDQTASDMFYRKCGLVMQMIELKIGELLDTILKQMYQDAVQSKERMITLESFRITYKDVCGIRPKEIFNNWIYSTSCPKLTLNYEFNKRYNSLDLTLKQESAAATNMRVHKNLQNKIDKIFGMSGQDLDKELFGESIDPNETFNVDSKSACKRWFTGNVNIVICQADGGGGEILKQQHKMNMKNYKSTVSAHITLQGRVRRTQNRKKDLDYLPQAALNEPQHRRIGPGGRPLTHVGQISHRRMVGAQADHDAATNQAAQMMLNQDVQKFEMNEFELEDFPHETKNIFRKELDNNPVLWIRVDPDMEYIRKVKVVQKKRNNWLFQLLREQDIVGQIEAVRQLHKFNEDLVYEILKTVSRNENYFYKVRKEVLKTMHKMEISVFNKFLSHEAFLLKCFNQKNFDETTGFYRENSFQNLLQYYLDRSVIKYISKSKEEKLHLTAASSQRLDELQQKQSKLANESNMEDADGENSPKKDHSADPGAVSASGQPQAAPSTMIQISFQQNQLTGIDAKGTQKNKLKGRNSAAARQHMLEISDYRIATDKVAAILLKVLEQNDNSENFFDDSFLVRDILASLGRLDNLNYMLQIVTEIYRQFKLDQISNSSPQFSVTIGAIKGHFNLRKQIYRFVHHKRQHIDPADPLASNRVKQNSHDGPSGGHHMAHQNQNSNSTGSKIGHLHGGPMGDSNSKEKDQIFETENVLNQMKEEIDGLLMDPLAPLQLRLFIFDEEIKNIIFYKSLPLVRSLQVIFDAIFNLQAKMEIRFATFCLREIVMFLESTKFVGRINFTELHIESEATIHLMDTVWSLICLPHGYLSSQIAYWCKRFINRVYGKILPKFLINRTDRELDPQILQTDEIWSKTEATLAAEEQHRTQLAEMQKQEFKHKQLMASHQQYAPSGHVGNAADEVMIVASGQGMNTSGNGQTVLNFNKAGGGGNSSLGSKNSKMKKPIHKLDSQRSIVSISNKPQASSGVTIRATNNSLATNEHILNISSGGNQALNNNTKISIQGTSIRLAPTSTEAKLGNELREVNNTSIAQGNLQNAPQQQTSAVVHLGPQTHSAITLQAPLAGASLQEQAAAAQSQQQHTPFQLVVLSGKLNGGQGEQQAPTDQADVVMDSNQMNTNGQQPDAFMVNVDSDDDDEDDDNHSRSMIKLNQRHGVTNGVIQVDQDDEDEDLMSDDEDADQEIDKRRKQANPNNGNGNIASFGDEDDNSDDEDVQMNNQNDEEMDDEYGDEQYRQRKVDGHQDNDNDSIYDPFAAEKFDDVDMQKCWLILGKLFYHYEVTDFLDPVTPDTFGDEQLYQEYCSVVSEPMDISTIMGKIRTHEYQDKYGFKRDVELVFDNCREFNEAGTEIVHCANSLTIEFNGFWIEYGMN